MGERADGFEEEKASANLVIAAALRHDAAALEKMRETGIRIDAQDGIGETALHQTCQAGNLEAVRLLLDAGANPNGVSRLGHTPLGLAVTYGYFDVAKLLLEKSADPDQLIDFGVAPLTPATESGDADMVRLLLENKASVTPRAPSEDHPAIIVAARQGHLPILRMMIEEFGVDINTAIASGET